ncbi:CST complex subunit Ten1 [Nemania sp. FL0916]|nr:CST complex subunit Ten1 [Nemania sp. FL0916]
MSNGPLPSERCLLSKLCEKQVGSKVRFLGCITGYSTRHAQVTLKHGCAQGNSDIEALVDVKLMLETLTAEQTDIGQWVHVIGYLTFVNPAPSVEARGRRGHSQGNTATSVGVQALILWIARDLDLAAYEKSMVAEANQNAEGLAPKHHLAVR